MSGMTGPINPVTISSLEEPIHKICAVVTYIPPAAPSKLSAIPHVPNLCKGPRAFPRSVFIIIFDKRKLAKKLDKNLFFLYFFMPE